LSSVKTTFPFLTGEQRAAGQITSFMSMNEIGNPRAARSCASMPGREIDSTRSYEQEAAPGRRATRRERHRGTSNGICGTSRITMVLIPALVSR
jgi:hypothetical protein